MVARSPTGAVYYIALLSTLHVRLESLRQPTDPEAVYPPLDLTIEQLVRDWHPTSDFASGPLAPTAWERLG